MIGKPVRIRHGRATVMGSDPQATGESREGREAMTRVRRPARADTLDCLREWESKGLPGSTPPSETRGGFFVGWGGLVEAEGGSTGSDSMHR